MQQWNSLLALEAVRYGNLTQSKPNIAITHIETRHKQNHLMFSMENTTQLRKNENFDKNDFNECLRDNVTMF